jgi:hypothetical protein
VLDGKEVVRGHWQLVKVCDELPGRIGHNAVPAGFSVGYPLDGIKGKMSPDMIEQLHKGGFAFSQNHAIQKGKLLQSSQGKTGRMRAPGHGDGMRQSLPRIGQNRGGQGKGKSIQSQADYVELVMLQEIPVGLRRCLGEIWVQYVNFMSGLSCHCGQHGLSEQKGVGPSLELEGTGNMLRAHNGLSEQDL